MEDSRAGCIYLFTTLPELFEHVVVDVLQQQLLQLHSMLLAHGHLDSIAEPKTRLRRKPILDVGIVVLFCVYGAIAKELSMSGSHHGACTLGEGWAPKNKWL